MSRERKETLKRGGNDGILEKVDYKTIFKLRTFLRQFQYKNGIKSLKSGIKRYMRNKKG